MKKLSLFTLLLSIVAMVGITMNSCTREGSFIQVKESTFCASIPEGQYSIICEITDHFGTTPEAVRIGMKLANLYGTDQWYEAEVADKFLADIQERVQRYKSAGGATWADLAAYIMGQYNLLPKKAQGAILISKDLFEFNPPEIQGRLLSALDWIRIEGNLADQRAILATFKS